MPATRTGASGSGSFPGAATESKGQREARGQKQRADERGERGRLAVHRDLGRPLRLDLEQGEREAESLDAVDAGHRLQDEGAVGLPPFSIVSSAAGLRGSEEREKGCCCSSSAKSGKYSSRAIVRSPARPGAPGGHVRDERAARRPRPRRAAGRPRPWS